MLAIPTPDLAVPYAAPTHENTNALAAPINPKNGATASPESSVDCADALVAVNATINIASIALLLSDEEEEEEIIFPLFFSIYKKLCFSVFRARPK
jgi:hypothetical protein